MSYSGFPVILAAGLDRRRKTLSFERYVAMGARDRRSASGMDVDALSTSQMQYFVALCIATTRCIATPRQEWSSPRGGSPVCPIGTRRSRIHICDTQENVSARTKSTWSWMIRVPLFLLGQCQIHEPITIVCFPVAEHAYNMRPPLDTQSTLQVGYGEEGRVFVCPFPASKLDWSVKEG